MIPIYKPYLKGNYKKYTKDVINSGWISSIGKYIELFEEAFKQYVGSKYAIAVSSGTAALQASVQFFENQDTTFLIPSMCYIAIPNSIKMYPNKKFIAGDLDKYTLNLDIKQILYYKDKIQAIIFV